MDKKQIIVMVFLVFAIFSLSKIRFFNEYLEPGQELELFTTVVNQNTRDADNVRITAYFPELGDFVSGRIFDVKGDRSYGQMLTWDVPSYAEPGDYLVRVTASNDKHTSRKFRWITIW